jgi:hypothetical protein
MPLLPPLFLARGRSGRGRQPGQRIDHAVGRITAPGVGQIRQELQRSDDSVGTDALELADLSGMSGVRDILATLALEVRALRSEVEKLRRTRLLPSD